MMKNDIVKEPLSIVTIFNVLESVRKPKKIAPQKAGRYSDVFVFVREGRCEYVFDDGKRFTAEAGDVIYLAEHAVYSMDIVSETYRCIFCDFQFYGNSDLSGKSILVKPSDSDGMENLFRRLKMEWNTPAVDSSLTCMITLYKIYSMLIRFSSTAYLSPDAKGMMEHAWNYIHSHISDADLSVASLARELFMSEAYFRRLFTARYGISPSRCIISARISHAKKLLCEETCSLEEIAACSGFSSSNYFSKVFKKHTGLTPGQFRNRIG